MVHTHISTHGARHLTSVEAIAEVRSGRVISDGAAATIASWSQSPGSVGSVLAALTSGLPVNYSDLLEDIRASRAAEDDRCPLDDADKAAFNALAMWAMHKAYA